MKKGYSLIELIFVVGALILISTFGISRYNDFNQRQIVEQTADSLISNLRLIQAKALSGDKPPVGCTSLVGWTVAFSANSYETYATCNNPPVKIPSTSVTVNMPSNVTLSWVGTITYYALGHGTSVDPLVPQTVSIVGTSRSVSVVLSAGNITR